ncbi:MAG: hypothetical protein ACLR4Z_08510 [Butyricicoccaceae bacterium]
MPADAGPRPAPRARPCQSGWRGHQDGLLQISHSVEYKSDCNQPTLKDTKTAAGVRFVPLPDELAAMLDKKSRYFFHRKDGRMLTATGLRRMWASFHRACDRAAGAEIYRNKIITHAFDPSIHRTICATYCSNLRRQGVDLKTAQYLMEPQRHSDDGQHLQPRYRGRHPKNAGSKRRSRLSCVFCEPGSIYLSYINPPRRSFSALSES